MKKSKELVWFFSGWVFVASILVFFGCIYFGYYNRVILSGGVALVSFIVFLIVMGSPDSKKYDQYLNRKKKV